MTRFIPCVAVVVALSSIGMASAESIPGKRAHDLATTYMMQYISLCGVVEEPISRDTYWELPIGIGQGAEPAGAIRVDKRTGSVSYPHHPTATPQSLAAWEKSLEKPRK